MRSVRVLIAAGAASLLSSMAFAADMPIAPPPYAPVADFGGWYLRGDIGFSNQSVGNLDNALYYTPGTTVRHQGLGFDTAGVFGVGVGYQFNNWLRADITGQYRGKANFHGADIVSFNGLPTTTDLYTASKSEWLTLANVYADLGTWWGITPFVGAGIGASRNTISSFTDLNPQTLGTAFGDTASKWNFAWAVHAGLAYRVNPAFTVELAYSYVDMGNAQSGDEYTFQGVNNVYNPMIFKHITSQDLMLGVRWNLESMPPYASPLITKG